MMRVPTDNRTSDPDCCADAVTSRGVDQVLPPSVLALKAECWNTVCPRSVGAPEPLYSL